MERFVKGDIVVLPFPFSDLRGFKKRPALIIADLKGDDIILCQITGEERKDDYSIILKSIDLEKGKLKIESRIRPNRLFTIDKSTIFYKLGKLKTQKIKEVESKIIQIIKN
jgi:mRNA interferase MazF